MSEETRLPSLGAERRLAVSASDRADMLDTWRPQKDLLRNFIRWLTGPGAVYQGKTTDEAGLDAMLEAFINTQVTGIRHVPYCQHCGSTEVISGDFKDEPVPVLDSKGRGRDLSAEGENGRVERAVRPETPSAPAWVCKCGHYSRRSV